MVSKLQKSKKNPQNSTYVKSSKSYILWNFHNTKKHDIYD